MFYFSMLLQILYKPQVFWTESICALSSPIHFTGGLENGHPCETNLCPLWQGFESLWWHSPARGNRLAMVGLGWGGKGSCNIQAKQDPCSSLHKGTCWEPGKLGFSPAKGLAINSKHDWPGSKEEEARLLTLATPQSCPQPPCHRRRWVKSIPWGVSHFT